MEGSVRNDVQACSTTCIQPNLLPMLLQWHHLSAPQRPRPSGRQELRPRMGLMLERRAGPTCHEIGFFGQTKQVAGRL